MTGSVRVPSPVQEIADPALGDVTFHLILKHDDLISPEFPGDKWRELAPNLDAARRGGHRTLLTFGGAWSNHVRATASARAAFGFALTGRGRRDPPPALTPPDGIGVRHQERDGAVAIRKRPGFVRPPGYS
jgi:1-aminocyclopropane-1-carboxylate deaminase